LEKNKIESLIIDAGEDEYSHDSQQNYKSEVVGKNVGDDLTHNRLRQFGGASGHWGGWC
jgi:hypothetical protein